MNWIFRTESAAFLAKAPTRDNWQDILRGLCRYFEENRAFYRNALAYTGQNSLREYLFDTFSGVVQQHLKSADSSLAPEDVAFAGEFFAATIVGLLERWCSRGMREEDAERYEKCLARILSGEMLEAYLHGSSG